MVKVLCYTPMEECTRESGEIILKRAKDMRSLVMVLYTKETM